MTSALFEALAAYDVTVLDMEQVVVRGTLVLGVLLGGARRARSRRRSAASASTWA